MLHPFVPGDESLSCYFKATIFTMTRSDLTLES